eukprot:m.164345 g.164345  ORF g.164345 m.164345 type:complete len:155 (-) comp12408_c0_seq1:634-1098(-)
MSAEGYHAVKYEDGDEYRGQWNGEGKRHGLGLLKFADGTEYAGDFENGMNHGFGVLTFPDKSSYAGEFKDGVYDGHGVFCKDETKYEGEFKDGKVDGSGKITFKDKTNGRPRQEGTFQNRMLKTGGKQQGAVNLAKEAEATAMEKANKAKDLRP